MTMHEDQFIKELKELKRIKPKKDWVSLTKKEILGEDRGFSFFPLPRTVFAGLVVVCVLFGNFGYGVIKNALPGDALYSIRKAAHEGQSFFVSKEEKSIFQLKLANDRLKDLATVPARNLAPTINEFQANIREAAKGLGNLNVSTSSPETMKKIVKETKEFEENKQMIESLGVVVANGGTSEFESALKKVVSDSIIDLKSRTLSENETEILEKMEQLVQEEKYSEALELYLTSQQ